MQQLTSELKEILVELQRIYQIRPTPHLETAIIKLKTVIVLLESAGNTCVDGIKNPL